MWRLAVLKSKLSWDLKTDHFSRQLRMANTSLILVGMRPLFLHIHSDETLKLKIVTHLAFLIQ